MLKQSTREKLQALVQHPDFAYISVEIVDKKMFHSSDEGRPTFYTNVNIHANGERSLSRITDLMPEIELVQHEPNRVEHDDHVSVGEYARGTLEGETVSMWLTFYEIPTKKAPTAMGATLENTQSNYTTESEVVANA